MPQAVDSPTERPTKDQCSVMVTNLKITNLKIMVVILYSTGLTRAYAGEIGIQMVTNNLNRERCKRGKNRKYNL